MQLKILIVDDEKEILETLKKYFNFSGYAKVDIVSNPLEAMPMIEKHSYDVVITDIAMPEMSGLDLVKQIRDYNGLIHIIVITAYTSTTNLLTALRRGAYEVVFKPFEDLKKFITLFEEIDKRIAHWYALLAKMKKG